jgi:hypothetical protein
MRFIIFLSLLLLLIFLLLLSPSPPHIHSPTLSPCLSSSSSSLLTSHSYNNSFPPLFSPRVDWAAYETSLIDGYMHAAVQSGRYAHISRRGTMNGFQSRAASIFPSAITLRSFCLAGDRCSLFLRNNLNSEALYFSLEKSPPGKASEWLSIKDAVGVVPIGGVNEVIVSNDHTATTLRSSKHVLFCPFYHYLELRKVCGLD